MNDTLPSKAASIVENAEIATIAVIDDQGYPRASTISNIQTEGIQTIWFTSGLKSGKVQCLTRNPKVSVCYHAEGNNVTLIGTVEILTDLVLKKQLWMDWFIRHFPGGVEDANYCVLKFTTQKAFLWIDSQYEEMDLGEI